MKKIILLSIIFLSFPVGVFSCLQYSQSFLKSLCAIETFKADGIVFGFTFKSISRGYEPAAELVCNVEKTKCPVRAAWIAVPAVSGSRISPTIITSGSCLIAARRPERKV